jgi:hypothetical protein
MACCLSDRIRGMPWRLCLRQALSIVLIVALGGCATIFHGGAPEPSFDVDADLAELAKVFGERDKIVEFYAAPSREARDKFIVGRLTMMNIRYIQFVRSITADKQLLDSAAQMLVLGLSLAGASVSGAATKTVLAAIAAGVTGSKEIIDKNYFYEKTVPALVAQMNAERKKALVPILTGMSNNLDLYRFDQAVTDLHNYYFAGTFTGALQAIQADAATKEQRQDQIIARLQPLSEVDIVTKASLTHAIGRLQATDLPKVQRAIKNLDPNVTPATEIEGAKAQLQGYVRGARTPEEIDKVKAAFTSAGVTVD